MKTPLERIFANILFLQPISKIDPNFFRWFPQKILKKNESKIRNFLFPNRLNFKLVSDPVVADFC